MNGLPITLTILGLDIAFKTGVDIDRVKEAASLLEEKFAAQKAKSRGTRSKDIILVFLALGLADELLRMKSRQDETQLRLESLLAKIEKSL